MLKNQRFKLIINIKLHNSLFNFTKKDYLVKTKQRLLGLGIFLLFCQVGEPAKRHEPLAKISRKKISRGFRKDFVLFRGLPLFSHSGLLAVMTNKSGAERAGAAG